MAYRNCAAALAACAACSGDGKTPADAPSVDALIDAAAPARCGEWPSPPGSSGRTWFVAPAGDDSGPGTEALPLATLQAAADRVSPGESIVVEDGTYTITTPAMVRVARGGTADAWVWFRARNPRRARLIGAGAAVRGFDLVNGIGFVRIQGFDISGLDGVAGAAAIDLESGGHDVEIIDNYLHSIGRVCTATTFGITAIYVHQPRAHIEGNHIADVGRLGAGEGGCAPTDTRWQTHDHGIYVSGANRTADGTTIVNNLFDREYVASCFNTYGCFWGAERQVVATATFRF